MPACIYVALLMAVLYACAPKPPAAPAIRQAPLNQEKISENSEAVEKSKVKLQRILKNVAFYRPAKEEDFTQLYEIIDEESLKLGQSSYGFRAIGEFKQFTTHFLDILESLLPVASSDPASEPSFGSRNNIFILFNQEKQFQVIIEIFDDTNAYGVIFDMVGYQIDGKNDLFMAVATSYDDPRILRSNCPKDTFEKILRGMKVKN